MHGLIIQPLSIKRSQTGGLLAIGLGILMTAFDSSAVGSILPIITHAFHSNVYTAKWVITLYILTITALLLAAGRFGDILGHRRLYLSGLAISSIGATLCAMATSIGMLALFRMVEGVGAVLILANAPALLTKLYAPTSWGSMLGLLSTMAYVGLVIGPSLSGLLAVTLGWRSVFTIPSLLAAIAFLLGRYSLLNDTKSKGMKRFNVLQTLVLAVVLGLLVLAFHLSDRFNWHSLPVLSLSAVALFAIAIVFRYAKMLSYSKQFIATQYNRPIALAAITAMLTYVALYSITFVLPFYLFSLGAFDAVKIGLILSARPAATALLAPLSGKLTDRYGTRILSFLGLLIILVALIELTTLNTQTQSAGILIPLAGIGIGMGIFLPPNHKLIMSKASVANKGLASAILSLTRNMGMLIGTSLAGTFFSGRPAHNHHSNEQVNSATRIVIYISCCAEAIALFIVITNIVVHIVRKKRLAAAGCTISALKGF
jgi:EmrB/QacA subfamily drug resistance transporter